MKRSLHEMLPVLQRLTLLLSVVLLLSGATAACGGDDAADAPADDTSGEIGAPAVDDTEGDGAAAEDGAADDGAAEEGDDAAAEDAEAGDDGEASDAGAEGEADADAVGEAETESMIVKLDLNSASMDEFQTLPGVGERMAREFDEYRPYASIAEFRKEMSKYVDDATIAGYEDYVYVPVSPNDSDAATLMQLPGVDEAVAETLIAGRPYASYAAFFTVLAELVTVEDVAAAAGYMSLE